MNYASVVKGKSQGPSKPLFQVRILAEVLFYLTK